MNALRLIVLAGALALAGCKSLPDKPTEQTMYDFGPAPAAASSGAATGLPLQLPDVQVTGILETSALLYRLAYEDAHRLRPYAYARWSAEPGELLRQRLRDVLGRDRPVLDSAASAALTRRGATPPPVLRVELEEFSHVFDSPAASRGVVRVRCTLLESTGSGERLVAQRTFQVERPAPTPDAPGGVRALAAAADGVAQELATWLRGR
ncbi:MAG TPA: ABC-type transport auxiliary lipoprotein family protein [Ramlibacter sp.]|nr:ABC-type transport auxiliary lipoprotein family protein [Ramlibacter sp.]